MEMEIRIRNCAYQIWLDDGCPDGKAAEHWEKAREKVKAEDENGSVKANQEKPSHDATRPSHR